MKRIVVTGMGIVSPLGCGVNKVWERLINGQSGINQAPEKLVKGIASHVVGSVPDAAEDVLGFDPSRLLSSKDIRKMDRFIQFAIAAADEALLQANWHPQTEEKRNATATIIASGVGGFPAMAEATRKMEVSGARKVSPFLIPSFLINLAAGQVSIRYGFKGPIGAPVTACAASAQSIGDGARMIHSGEADVVLCGGAEAGLDKVALAGFAAARALSTSFNDTPEKASRPFDQTRDGFVMSEGAGIMIIESMEHAIGRGSTPLAELVGYGTTSDAFHITSGQPEGKGAAHAMKIALRQAQLEPKDINYINAHATSTPVGDAAEIAAIKSVFGSQFMGDISSTKSATGHTLGAAGAIESIFSIMSLRTGVIPPTINLEKPDEISKGLNLIGSKAVKRQITYVLSNAFGFGGVNASLVFKKWNE
mgnify:CR=1 FL=1